MEGEKIGKLHHDHREWLNKLDFYNDDLPVLRHRLEEVAGKNNGTEMLPMLEHFQNQFIIQKNEIDEFKHAIKAHEHTIVDAVNANPTAINRQRLADHPEMNQRMEQFEKLFQEFRMELMRFLAKYM